MRLYKIDNRLLIIGKSRKISWAASLEAEEVFVVHWHLLAFPVFYAFYDCLIHQPNLR